MMKYGTYMQCMMWHKTKILIELDHTAAKAVVSASPTSLSSNFILIELRLSTDILFTDADNSHLQISDPRPNAVSPIAISLFLDSSSAASSENPFRSL